MSLHIESTEEAAETMRREKRKNYIAAIATAFLAVVLGGTILYCLTIIIAPPEEPAIVTYVTPDEGPPADAPPPPEVQRETSSASHAELPVKVVVSTAAAPISMPKLDIEAPEEPTMLEVGTTLGMGDGFGPDLGDDVSGFGSSAPSGSSLVGTFYDLKQTPGGRPSDISINDKAALFAILKKFVNDGWNEKLFARYYKAPKQLYASQWYIPYCLAAEGPKAYGEPNVKPSHWVAVYRGKVRAPKSGEFRFVGFGDDFLVVRFNNQNVFDYGYCSASMGVHTAAADFKKWGAAMQGQPGNDDAKKELEKAGIMVPPVTFYKYTGTGKPQMDKMNIMNGELGGAATGKKFKVERDRVYPIEILISEAGGAGAGNKFATALLIEEVGMEPIKKDPKTGSPILPLFRTNYGVPDQSQHIPFDEVGPVWQSVK